MRVSASMGNARSHGPLVPRRMVNVEMHAIQKHSDEMWSDANSFARR